MYFDTLAPSEDAAHPPHETADDSLLIMLVLVQVRAIPKQNESVRGPEVRDRVG